MGMIMGCRIKRWIVKRKAELVMEIMQGKSTVAEAFSAFYRAPPRSEPGSMRLRGMENVLRVKPMDIRKQYEKQLKELQEAYGEVVLELRARK